MGKQALSDYFKDKLKISASVTFEKFTDMYSGLKLCAELIGEEIVRQVLAPSEYGPDSEDDTPVALQLSNTKLMQVLVVPSSVLRDGMTPAEIQANMIVRKQKAMQQTIDNFCQPQGL